MKNWLSLWEVKFTTPKWSWWSSKESVRITLVASCGSRPSRTQNVFWRCVFLCVAFLLYTPRLPSFSSFSQVILPTGRKEGTSSFRLHSFTVPCPDCMFLGDEQWRDYWKLDHLPRGIKIQTLLFVVSCSRSFRLIFVRTVNWTMW
jgi:hypothetical protein